jgi:ankyrin repeat protein
VSNPRIAPKAPNVQYLTSKAFLIPPIIEVDYKAIYPDEIRAERYTENASTSSTPFKDQFHKLLNSYYLWAEKNIIPAHPSDTKGAEISRSIVNFMNNIFDKNYSGSLTTEDFEKMKSDLEVIYHQLNNPTIPLEKRINEFNKLIEQFYMCALGVSDYLQQSVLELNGAATIDNWLTKFRDEYIHYAVAMFDIWRTSENQRRGYQAYDYADSIHTHRTYSEYALEQGWNPPFFSVKKDDKADPLVKTTYKVFDQGFRKHYSPEHIVSMLTEKFLKEIKTFSKEENTNEVEFKDKPNEKGWLPFNYRYQEKSKQLFKRLVNDEKSEIDIFDHFESDKHYTRINTGKVKEKIIETCQSLGIFDEFIVLDNKLYFINDYMPRYDEKHQILNGPSVISLFSELKVNEKTALIGTVLNRLPEEIIKRFLSMINIKRFISLYDNYLWGGKIVGEIFNRVQNKNKWPVVYNAIASFYPDLKSDLFTKNITSLTNCLNNISPKYWKSFNNVISPNSNFLITFAEHGEEKMALRLIKEGGYDPNQTTANGKSVFDLLNKNDYCHAPIFFIPDEKWFTNDEKTITTPPEIKNWSKAKDYWHTTILFSAINEIKPEHLLKFLNIKEIQEIVSATISTHLRYSDDGLFTFLKTVKDANKWKIFFDYHNNLEVARNKPFIPTQTQIKLVINRIEEIGGDKFKKINESIIPGNTITHIAAAWGTKEFIQPFLNIGISINSQNKDGQTILHVAAHCNNQALVDWLLDKPFIDLDIADNNGVTPFDEIYLSKSGLKKFHDPFINDLLNPSPAKDEKTEQSICNWNRIPKSGKSLFNFIGALLNAIPAKSFDTLLAKLPPYAVTALIDDILSPQKISSSHIFTVIQNKDKQKEIFNFIFNKLPPELRLEKLGITPNGLMDDADLPWKLSSLSNNPYFERLIFAAINTLPKNSLNAFIHKLGGNLCLNLFSNPEKVYWIMLDIHDQSKYAYLIKALLSLNGNFKKYFLSNFILKPNLEYQLADWENLHNEILSHTDILHQAVQSNDEKLVAELLTAGAPINSTDSLGRTALHIAADNGFTTLTEYLLSQKADTQILDKLNKSPDDILIKNKMCIPHIYTPPLSWLDKDAKNQEIDPVQVTYWKQYDALRKPILLGKILNLLPERYGILFFIRCAKNDFMNFSDEEVSICLKIVSDKNKSDSYKKVMLPLKNKPVVSLPFFNRKDGTSVSDEKKNFSHDISNPGSLYYAASRGRADIVTQLLLSHAPSDKYFYDNSFIIAAMNSNKDVVTVFLENKLMTEDLLSKTLKIIKPDSPAYESINVALNQRTAMSLKK